MFEKEAKEYREEWQNKGYYFVSQEMEQIELDDIVDATFKDGAEFGYNSANEWHNPEEKLPTKDCEVLIEYGEYKTHRVVDWNNKYQIFVGFSIGEVTRWKEIE